MPAVLDDWPCPACGGRHTLCLDDDARAWSDRDFAYTCPDIGQAVAVSTAGWDRLGPDRPDGSVTLLPAGG